jgi:hypothetical protein
MLAQLLERAEQGDNVAAEALVRLSMFAERSPPASAAESVPMTAGA